MVMKAVNKDTFREIRKSIGRFLSIFFIVAIGTAFFAGIQGSVPVMKHTADKYFDDYNLMDIRVVSTLGLTEHDAGEIRKIKGVEGVYPAHVIDMLADMGTTKKVLRLHGIPLGNRDSDNRDYINQVKLVEGRMPEKSGECLMEDVNFSVSGFEIGDRITLESGTENPVTDSLKTAEYTIVGTAHIPYYISFEKGSSSIGYGSVDNFLLVPEEDFDMDYFTDIFITVSGAKDVNCYTGSYFEITDPVTDALKSIGVDCAALRFQDIKGKAEEELEKGRKEFEEKKAEFESEIGNASKKIDNGKLEISNGEKTLENKKSEYEKTVKESEEKIADAEQQLRDGEKAYKENYDLYYKKAEESKPLIQSMEDGLKTLKDERDSAQKKLNELNMEIKRTDLTDARKSAIEAQIAAYTDALNNVGTEIELLSSQLESAKNELSEGAKQLESARKQLDDSEEEIRTQKENLEEGKKTALKEFADAEAEILKSKEDIAEAETGLEENRKKGENELTLAEEELIHAQAEIDSIEEPEWYVLDRNSHYGYVDYKGTADRMQNIAKIFPVFFFIIAILVCLTTMTRMVDEQRGTIGTLKALGYAPREIAMKYISYAGIASIGGGIAGCALGIVLFPTVIFNAWGLVYMLPPVSLIFQPVLVICTILVASIVTIMAAFLACYKELAETPAMLMRPKAPKLGKKIFLERIPFIWKNLSFIKKVTARNLFRYKKRFFMTIIGVSGCTALLLAGFGINDSISDIARLHFGEIHTYDGSVSYTSEAESKGEIESLLSGYDIVENFLGAMQYSQDLKNADREVTVSVTVPGDVEKFKEFMTLRERTGKKEVSLSDSGVLITEKLSKELGLRKGDKLILSSSGGKDGEVEITGIIENYVGHYVIISPVCYRTVFSEAPKNNIIFMKLNDSDAEDENRLGQELMEDDRITSVSFNTGIMENFEKTISSLSIITVVLVIAAGALAFVVLYNLTNVNISERLREIATIKVLGFYDREVSSYVYRENILLTIIGSFAGLGMGIFLHRFVMNVAEMDRIMFGRNIGAISFLYSVLLTIGFSMLVNLAMYRKLKNIPMVESLKSVE